MIVLLNMTRYAIEAFGVYLVLDGVICVWDDYHAGVREFLLKDGLGHILGGILLIFFMALI